MAAPTSDAYSTPSGGQILAGRWGARLVGAATLGAVVATGALATTVRELTGGVTAASLSISGSLGSPPSSTAAFVGDSLTDENYGLTTATWLGGIAGGVLQPVKNAGVASEEVAGTLARIDHSYTSNGLAGLAAAVGVAKLGWVVLRIGTNDARASRNYSGIATNFAALMTKLVGYAERVIICSVPPLVGDTGGLVADINAGYEAYAAAHPTTCIYIDDGSVLRVGGTPTGDAIAGYFTDGVHMSHAGVRRMGIAGGVAFSAALASLGIYYQSPLVTSNTDTYAVTPASAQWSSNPAMTGTVVRTGSFPGNSVAGYTVGPTGSGAGTISIVAADVGDPNQTPWQRITPTEGAAAGATGVYISNAGRSITSGDPTRCESIVQVRFNALDVTNVKRLTASCRGNTSANQYALPDFHLSLGSESTTVSETVTMRSNLPRTGGVTESGWTLFLSLEYTTTFSGASMGSFDVRCQSMRG